MIRKRSAASNDGTEQNATHSIRPAVAPFASAREQRLWMWTLAVVVGIYSTLGLARTLAGVLRARDLLDGLFVLGFLLVLGTIAWQGIRRRPGGLEVAVVLGVAAVYLLVFVRMGIPEERTHLVEYGVLAVLIYEALLERARNGRRVPMPAVLAVLGTALLGALDEGIQAVLPNRVFDPVDMLVNFLAGLMAVGASVALSRVGRQRTYL
ncbi:MAG: VanZ family protein [Acidimicrobiia bacterium]|nr:VanZ family protein [Acidimicrobiia bacterium]